MNRGRRKSDAALTAGERDGRGCGHRYLTHIAVHTDVAHTQRRGLIPHVQRGGLIALIDGDGLVPRLDGGGVIPLRDRDGGVFDDGLGVLAVVFISEAISAKLPGALIGLDAIVVQHRQKPGAARDILNHRLEFAIVPVIAQPVLRQADGVEGEPEWAVTYFGKTLFTPAGLDVYARSGTALSKEMREAIIEVRSEFFA